MFGNCVKQDSNNSHFSIKREKLARRREIEDFNLQAWVGRYTPPCLAGKGGARQESENRSRKEILKRQIEVRYKESRTANLGLELKNKIFFSSPLFVCLPAPKRFWRKSCNFRALFLSSFVIGSQISQFQGSGCTRKEAFSTWLLTVYLISYMGCSLLSTF